MKNSAFAAAVMWFLTVVSIASAAPVIVNGGFETGLLSPWTSTNGSAGWYNGSGWAVSTAAAHSGTYGAAADGNWAIKQAFAAGVSTLDIASASFWIRRPNANPVDAANDGIAIYIYVEGQTWPWGAPKPTVIARDQFITGTGWQYVDLTSALPTDKTIVAIETYGYLNCASGPCSGLRGWTTYVDDFNITLKSEVVPEPASIVLVGTALFSVLALRRRKNPARSFRGGKPA